MTTRRENERSFSYFAAHQTMTTATMSPAKVQRQSDRRAEILEAAQRCFVRSGFHQTSMHEICAEAGMSAGNLYRYFPSMEALIAGIAERDRAEVARDIEQADMSLGLPRWGRSLRRLTCRRDCSPCWKAWRTTIHRPLDRAGEALHRGDGGGAP
jgi:AcrR family transcriptional regulator